jgi:hypothetical protein
MAGHNTITDEGITMTSETEKIIDGMIARTPESKTDRIKLRALLRRRVIEAVGYQFKEGLELTDIGTLLQPENMINLIADYTESGAENDTWKKSLYLQLYHGSGGTDPTRDEFFAMWGEYPKSWRDHL